ncbi:MAG: RsmE family RNA methyltransferase [bacterium]
MPIYFINENDITGDIVRISGGNFHHLSNVLRREAGDEIFVSDTKEKYRLRITSVSKKHLEAKIINREKIQSGREITLTQCLPKKNKMDTVARANVELGVRNIIPVISERSVPRLDDAREQKLLSRWRKVSIEQAQQSGIPVLPNVSGVQKFEEAVQNLKGFDLVIIPWEEEKSKKIKDVLKNCKNVQKIAIIIGPEGGLTAEEVNFAEKTGAIRVSLGGTIFRTEIAGLIAVSIIKYQFDWL